jgi:MFS family permease
MPSFQRHMGNYDSNNPADQTRKGWLTSILELGAWFGTLLSGFLAETASRKYGILIATSVFILGVVIQTTAISAGHNSILGGRFITLVLFSSHLNFGLTIASGMGVGSLSMIVPMYNAEVAPPEVRGSLIALQQLAICFGIMISFWIDYGTNYIGGTGPSQHEAAWLLPICLQLSPAAVLFGGMIFMPFSPRWLVHHNREEEARKVLASLRNLPPDHELV